METMTSLTLIISGNDAELGSDIDPLSSSLSPVGLEAGSQAVCISRGEDKEEGGVEGWEVDGVAGGEAAWPGAAGVG